jgi:hypothetical protein
MHVLPFVRIELNRKFPLYSTRSQSFGMTLATEDFKVTEQHLKSHLPMN